MTLQSEYLLGIVSARFASSGEESSRAKRQRFCKSSRGIEKECIKNYRTFLLKAQGKFVFFLFFFIRKVAGKWILTLARHDETRCVNCDLCLFAIDIIETDGVREARGNIYIARRKILKLHFTRTYSRSVEQNNTTLIRGCGYCETSIFARKIKVESPLTQIFPRKHFRTGIAQSAILCPSRCSR